MVKRLISLGLEKPKITEGDNIYVDFKFDKACNQIAAVAYSNNKFTYHTPSLAGNLLTRSGKCVSTDSGSPSRYWQLDIDGFIKDLAESNNGEVNRYRLIEDGSKLVTKISEARDLLKTRGSGFLCLYDNITKVRAQDNRKK